MKFRVGGTVTISMYVDVEADSPEEAKEIASRAGVMSLCHQCCRNHEDQWSTSGEIDGEPEVSDEEPIGLGDEDP